MLKTDYKFGEAFSLVSQVAKNDSKVEFKDIMNNGNGGVALLAFCAGQELPTHQAPAEVMVYVLEGGGVHHARTPNHPASGRLFPDGQRRKSFGPGLEGF